MNYFPPSFLGKRQSGATRGQSFELAAQGFHWSKAQTLCSAHLSKPVAAFPCCLFKTTASTILNSGSKWEWCDEDGMLKTCLPLGKAGNFAILSKKTLESENVLSPAEGGFFFFLFFSSTTCANACTISEVKRTKTPPLSSAQVDSNRQ